MNFEIFFIFFYIFWKILNFINFKHMQGECFAPLSPINRGVGFKLAPRTERDANMIFDHFFAIISKFERSFSGQTFLSSPYILCGRLILTVSKMIGQIRRNDGGQVWRRKLFLTLNLIFDNEKSTVLNARGAKRY